jgi:hypothetical protein
LLVLLCRRGHCCRVDGGKEGRGKRSLESEEQGSRHSRRRRTRALCLTTGTRCSHVDLPERNVLQEAQRVSSLFFALWPTVVSPLSYASFLRIERGSHQTADRRLLRLLVSLASVSSSIVLLGHQPERSAPQVISEVDPPPLIYRQTHLATVPPSCCVGGLVLVVVLPPPPVPLTPLLDGPLRFPLRSSPPAGSPSARHSESDESTLHTVALGAFLTGAVARKEGSRNSLGGAAGG